MSELDRSIFMVERESELRWFGFFASILERTPILGIIFSISNRVAVAMYTHDLEKRQHQFQSKALKLRETGYVSKTQSIELDLPAHAIGNFPKKIQSLEIADTTTYTLMDGGHLDK